MPRILINECKQEISSFNPVPGRYEDYAVTFGDAILSTRKVIGEKTPVVISLDLHGILTDRMLEHSDAATVYQTYPHVDFFQTGSRAARLLLRLLDGEIQPVTARVAIPALVRGDELITETGLFGKCIRQAQAIEGSPGGLSAGMFVGNPFTDVPDLGSNAFLVTDGDAQRSEREAIDLAREFWTIREHLHADLVSLDETVRLAAEAKGRVILVDAADATSSGASGDSNAIVRALLEGGYRRSLLAPIVDAPAVNAALAAGIGRDIRVTIGGSLDPKRFRPLPIDAHICMLSEGRFRSESHGEIWNSGPTAVLRTGTYTLVVTSRPVSLYDRSLFFAHGQNPILFDAVIVKSPYTQPRFFAAGAEKLINVDAPGSSSANLKSLGHKHCMRPIYPLDKNVVFQPHAKIFQRNRL